MKYPISLIAASLFTLSANASDINITGFADFVGGKSISGPSLQLNDFKNNNFDASSYSRVALQGTVTLSEKITGTTQFIARGNNDWDLEVEWAYMTYTLNDNVRVNVGHQRLPFFIFSDVRDVGYAYPWISAPETVYSVPTEKYDGFNLMLQRQLGNATVQGQFIYGSMDDVINSPEGSSAFESQEVRVESDNVHGVTFQVLYDNITFRASYLTSTINASLESPEGRSFENYIKLVDPNTFAQVATEEDDVTFAGVGFQWDIGGATIWSEVTKIKYSESIFADEEVATYISIAKPFGNVTPYVTIGRKNQNNSMIDFTGSLLPQEIIMQIIHDTEVSDTNTDYYQTGLRYELNAGTALKFEIKRIRDRDLNLTNDVARFGLSVLF
jgi:hypothetical protein